MSSSTESIIKNITKKLSAVMTDTPHLFVGCNGKNIKELGKLTGIRFDNDIFSESHRRQRIKTLLTIFGITLTTNNTEVRLAFKNANNVSTWIKHITPFLEFIGTSVLDRVKANFLSTIPSDELIPTLKRMVCNCELVEKLMSYVKANAIKAAQKRKDITETSENKVNIISALKLENQQLKRQVEKANSTSGAEELLIERISESIDSILPELKFINEKWSGGTTFKKNEHATAVLHISDWHIGAQENVNGFNDFNYSIACDRVKLLTNKYIDWTKMHRSMYNIDELVIIATGDMISGDIHEELLRTNEFSVPEQCVKASMLLAKMTNELSHHFKKVRVEYIVADNHSRTTKKIQFGDGKNSYNYIIGTMTKLMLKDNSAVEFFIYPEIQKVIQIENLRYLITHGNCVRGGFAGIPFYSMQRKVGAEAAVRMNMPEHTHFDKIVMGHYHTPMRSTSYEMTGCLSSTTAFDQASGRHCRACQTGWVVSKDNELDYYELWLS
jgi:hypothetical protein